MGTSIAKFSDDYGRRKVFLLGAILGSLGLLAGPFSPNFWVFIVTRCVCALGQSLLGTAGFAVAVNSFPPDRRAKQVSLAQGGGTWLPAGASL